MNTHRVPLLLASLLLAACSNVVITDGGNEDGNINMGGTGGIGVGGSAGTGPVAPTFPAVVMTRAQQDMLWEQYWSTHTGPTGSTGSGGAPLDPNDLIVTISDQGLSCGSPPLIDLACGGHWELSLDLSPALQQVGVYDLHNGAMDETGDPSSSDPNDCVWSGGPPDGTFEILSIDATEVHFRVTAPSGGFFHTNPSGEYTAPRCP